jgi:hypothetical protein
MIEVLNFVFSSFWTFCGTVILLTIIVSPLVTFAAAFGASLDLRRKG